MTIKRVVISGIRPKYTSEYIANVLWRRNLAQVSSITLFPYLLGSRPFQTAYVTLASWADSEAAYNLIQRLKDETKKSFIVHKDDFQWRVQIDDRDEHIIFAESTPAMVFPESYFSKEVEKNSRPVASVAVPYIFGPNLTLVEAEARCDELRSIEWIDKALEICCPWHSNLNIAKPLATPAYLPIGNEIAFLEKEITLRKNAAISENIQYCRFPEPLWKWRNVVDDIARRYALTRLESIRDEYDKILDEICGSPEKAIFIHKRVCDEIEFLVNYHGETANY